MSQEIKTDSSRLRAVSIEDFEMKIHNTDLARYIPCKMYTVLYNDGEKRRYLVSYVGRYVITKEIECGFWRDNCATYECLSNMFWIDHWIAKDKTIIADEKDINFVDWVREKL